MKKCVLPVAVAMCLLIGCVNNTFRWEFLYEFDYVKEIKLIEMYDEYNYSVIKEIDITLAEELYIDISSLEMTRYGMNLSAPYGICFLVIFENGEYDIISQKESKHYKFDQGKLVAHNSWLCCDEDKYMELVEKYM